MDHAITIGEVLIVLGWFALGALLIGIGIAILAFMASGWNH